MVEEAETKSLVKERLESARERIAAAESLLKDGMLPDAVNRIYFAAFNAAKAVLNSLGKDPKTHAGLVSEYGLFVIKGGHLPKKYGVLLRKSFEARESADYTVAAEFSGEEVKGMLAGIREFVRANERLAGRLLEKYEQD